MLWENIQKCASFDKTAYAIMAAGPEKIAKRFRERIKPMANGCWGFSGHKSAYGHSKICFRWGRGTYIGAYAHRVAWLLHGAEVDKNLVLDHKCWNPECVNPAHLRHVTQQENVLSGLAPSSINSKKTHCKNGHEFTTENTYYCGKSGKPGRGCRTCFAAYHIEYRKKLKLRKQRVSL